MARIGNSKDEPKRKIIYQHKDDDDDETIDTNEPRFKYPLYPTSITFRPERHRKKRY